MTNSETSDPKVTAKWTVDGREYEAPVVNPGDWFGKTWHLSVCISNTGGPHYIVEADTACDAIDILAESEEYGHIIAIDVDVAGDDYGEPLSDGIELTDEKSARADEAAKRIRGPVGSVIELTIRREKLPEPLTFSLKRARVKDVNNLRKEMLTDGIGYLSLRGFTQDSSKDLAMISDEILASLRRMLQSRTILA